MRKLTLALALLLLAACNNIQNPVDLEFDPSVNGTVLDAGNGAPIAGAEIRVGNRQTISAANGTFLIAEIEKGTHTVTATKAGYVTYSGEVKVEQAFTPKNVVMTRQ